MRLKELISPLKGASVIGDEQAEVTGICIDSRVVAKGPGNGGPLFAAIPGEHVDGRDFIAAAASAGACAILANSPVEGVEATQVIVDDVRAALSIISDAYYGKPSREIAVTGITGTNGKTTTAYILESILDAAGFASGVVGTVNYRHGGKVFPAPHTTPQAPELHRILRQMADSGVTHCVMEVSSHALEQKRAADCAFRVGVFTNLTHDHLDYHLTMEEYYRCKALLFGIVREHGGVLVTNIDNSWGRLLKRDFPESMTYSLGEGADIYPKEFSLEGGVTRARLRTPSGVVEFTSQLAGEYNLQNIMAAAGAAFALGTGLDAIKSGIEALQCVPGRLEKFVSPHGWAAYVDYAHTGDALERALGALTQISSGRIITVFGCGGNRDRTKRPEMGEVATRLSDFAIVTSDNPRDEDPAEIIREIEAGITGVKKYSAGEELLGRGYMTEPDRADAIKKAVSMAQRGDTILIAGKGHEDYQIVKGEKRHFSDFEVLFSAAKGRVSSDAGGAGSAGMAQ